MNAYASLFVNPAFGGTLNLLSERYRLDVQKKTKCFYMVHLKVNTPISDVSGIGIPETKAYQRFLMPMHQTGTDYVNFLRFIPQVNPGVFLQTAFLQPRALQLLSPPSPLAWFPTSLFSLLPLRSRFFFPEDSHHPFSFAG